MKIELTVDRIEKDKVVFTADDQTTIIWPKTKLPNDLTEGKIFTFIINERDQAGKSKQELAKNILNEILKTND